ncbi:Hypp4708 [Branchiostoma lanceolatum]|uniref:Hypp4708 protein n=2 Tax=Branchiostoma lanceolatum TaxID=7740 RepID=A0A8K0AC94_BRALA|nr:Hypp4708 [Branchiostoma lanceolatum]
MPAFPYGTAKALSALHLVVGVAGIVLGVAELFFKTREDARTQRNKALLLTVGDVGTPIIGGLWFLLVGSVGASLEPGGPNNKCKIAAYHVLSVISGVLFAPAMGIIAANSISQRHDAPCTPEACAEMSGILGIQAAVIAAAVVEVCLSVTTATICCCWAPPSTAQVMPLSVPYTIQVMPQSPGPAQQGAGRVLVPQPRFYLPNQVMTDDIDFKRTTADEGIGLREDVKKTSSSQTPPPARDVGCNTQDKLIPWLGISAQELEHARATLRPPPPKKAWAGPGAILRRITKQQNGYVWPLRIPKSHAIEKTADCSGDNGPNPSTSNSKSNDYQEIVNPGDDENEPNPPTAPTPPPSPLPRVVIE